MMRQAPAKEAVIRKQMRKVLTELITGVNQISPHANALVVVVSQARRTLVFGSLAVPAGVKDTAVRGVSKDAIQSGTIGCADRRLCLRGNKANGVSDA